MGCELQTSFVKTLRKFSYELERKSKLEQHMKWLVWQVCQNLSDDQIAEREGLEGTRGIQDALQDLRNKLGLPRRRRGKNTDQTKVKAKKKKNHDQTRQG